ncbi:hypothetical protein BCR42DRAFT_444831 [Absidia repens]|uniref:Uncharacterized protein n=1 Tax=Absidia repens TaxID=90262 RepID=A0A1X2H718_9FUNG|nr:hypothetical protein BCR42DRAFT_444831 [Absidia repens]
MLVLWSIGNRSAYSITDASIEPLARSLSRPHFASPRQQSYNDISIDSSMNTVIDFRTSLFGAAPIYHPPPFEACGLSSTEICLKFWSMRTSFLGELQEHIPDFVRFDRLTHLDFKKPSMPFVLSLLLTSQTPTTATTTTTNSKVRWPYLTHLTLTDQDGDIEVDSFNNSEHNLDMGYQLGARVLEAMAAFLPKLSYLDLSCNKKIARMISVDL